MSTDRHARASLTALVAVVLASCAALLGGCGLLGGLEGSACHSDGPTLCLRTRQLGTGLLGARPSAAADADGNAIAIFYDGEPTRLRIRWSRFDADEQRWSAPAELGFARDGAQLVWRSNSTACAWLRADDGEVVVSRFDHDTLAWQEAVALGQSTGSRPAVAIGPRGERAYVGWLDSAGVRLARLEGDRWSSGELIAARATITAPGTRALAVARAPAWRDIGLVVGRDDVTLAWLEQRPSIGEPIDLVLTRGERGAWATPAAAALGSHVSVDALQLAESTGESSVLVWQVEGFTGTQVSRNGVYGARAARQPLALTAPQKLYNKRDALAPALAELDGDVLAAWGEGDRIFWRDIDASRAQPAWSALSLLSVGQAAGSDSAPAVSLHPDGSALVLWRNTQQDGQRVLALPIDVRTRSPRDPAFSGFDDIPALSRSLATVGAPDVARAGDRAAFAVWAESDEAHTPGSGQQARIRSARLSWGAPAP